jgi:hypothetical protein
MHSLLPLPANMIYEVPHMLTLEPTQHPELAELVAVIRQGTPVDIVDHGRPATHGAARPLGGTAASVHQPRPPRRRSGGHAAGITAVRAMPRENRD